MLHLRAVQMGRPSSIGRRCRSPPACTRRQLLWIVARRPQVRLRSALKSANLSFSSAMPFFTASKSDNVAANGGRLTIASSCASQNVCVHSWLACSCCVPRFSSLPQKLQGRLKSQIFKSGRFPQFQNRVRVRATLAGVSLRAVSRQPLGRTLSCVKWCDFSVVSTQKSIDTRHHSPPLRGGRASGRRGHNAGSGRPRPREKNVISAHWCTAPLTSESLKNLSRVFI